MSGAWLSDIIMENESNKHIIFNTKYVQELTKFIKIKLDQLLYKTDKGIKEALK